MERPGEQQIGSTSDPQRRIARHASDGWELLDLLGPLSDAYAVEQSILSSLRLRGVAHIPGTLERWSTAHLEATSLWELLPRS